jgi:hypothetical protein
LARVEDFVLRQAVLMEVNGHEELDVIAAGYERLVQALRDGRALGDEHAALARQAKIDDIESIRVAMGVGEGESFGFSRSRSPVEQLHQLAVVLDALLAVGAVDRGDVEAFLVHRAEVSHRAGLTDPWDEPGEVGVIDAALDGVLAGMSPGDALVALYELRGFGVISMSRWDTVERALLDAHPELESDVELVGPSEIGEVCDTLLGPSGRWCGVRVLAIELCEHGLALHVHQAVNPADSGGRHEPLADERMADFATWPLAPRLELHDDRGTAYRGCLEGVELDAQELEEEEGVQIKEVVAFAPAMAPGATRLWLASRDGRLRIDLT